MPRGDRTRVMASEVPLMYGICFIPGPSES